MKSSAILVRVALLACVLIAPCGATCNSLNAQTPAAPSTPATINPKPTNAPSSEIPNPTTANDSPSQTVKDSNAAEVSSPVPLATEVNAPIVDKAEKDAKLKAVMRVPMFENAPVIDGRLDDAVWKTAVRLADFYQISPGDNTAPSKPTIAYFGYDAKHFYMAFHAFDEPAKIRSQVSPRDSVFDQDNIRVFLDTFNDGRRAYLVGFNPLGIQADGIYREGGNTDYSVDIVMESKGVITKDGYTIEVAIPFKSLRYEAGKGKFWRFNVRRNIDRLNDELDSYTPISRDIAGLLNQSPRLTGLEGIDTERTFEIIPSLTLSQTGNRVRTIPLGTPPTNPLTLDAGRFVNGGLDFDPGLTAKFGITPTVTLDFALNPDFAQVEADATVVTANQRFPIFFPEKRPFFLEGIDIFQTRMNIVNTRRIIDPDYAAKLTGKRGRNTFGLILASDNAPGNYSDDERNDPRLARDIQRFADKNAFIGVLRLKRDIGNSDSNIGLFATSYNFIGRHNQLGGFDGRFRLTNQIVAEFQILGTTSRRSFLVDAPTSVDPEAQRKTGFVLNGFGYSYLLDKTGRNFGYTVSGVGRTQG